MFCPECGTKNSEDSLFCGECGFRFTHESAVSPSGGTSSGKRLILVIAAGALIVTAVIAAFLLLDIQFTLFGPDGLTILDWAPFAGGHTIGGSTHQDDSDARSEARSPDIPESEASGRARSEWTPLEEDSLAVIEARPAEPEPKLAGEPVAPAYGETESEQSHQGKIVFTCQVTQQTNQDQICLINPDGSGFKQMTYDTANEHYYPSLAPDGRSIVYSGSVNGRGYEIFEMDLQGNAVRLTEGLGELHAPEISPDGSRIVFTRHISSSQQYISVMNRDGSNVRNLTGYTDCKDPTWSADGSQILFVSSESGSPQVYVMNADGSGIRRITNQTGLRGRTSWSTDGVIGTYFGEQSKHNREIIFFDEQGASQVITSGGDNLSPSFSPDGEWITFMSYRDNFWDSDGCEIYVMRVDGSGLKRLTENGYCDYQPRWGN